MRIVLLALCLAAVVLIVHSFRAAPVKAQSEVGDWSPFTAGQPVTLHVDLPASVIPCKVTQVVNGFIGCAKDEAKRQSTGQWINLRNVQRITPGEK
jgi:hypothetical protein